MTARTMRPVTRDDLTGEGEPGSAAWWRERQARDGRRRPRADGLSVEGIIAAALAVVDGDGLDALTVRRLADDLQTGSASLYRHFASRDELLVLLVDHVIGEVDMPPAGLDGRTKTELLAGELRRALMAHPNLLPALTASPLLGPNAMVGSEMALTNLLDAGFDPAAAVPAYLALIDYVLGTVYFDTSSAGRDLMGPDARAELLSGLPVEMAAELTSNQPVFDIMSADGVFTFGLTTFLDGLECRFPHS